MKLSRDAETERRTREPPSTRLCQRHSRRVTRYLRSPILIVIPLIPLWAPTNEKSAESANLHSKRGNASADTSESIRGPELPSSGPYCDCGGSLIAGTYSNVGPAVDVPSSVGMSINACVWILRRYIKLIAVPSVCGLPLNVRSNTRKIAQ